MLTLRSHCKRRFGAGLLAAAVACAPAVFATPAAAEADLIGDVAVGYLTGDYDSDFDTELYSVTTRVRWLFGRGEIRISLPYLQLESEGTVAIVGGTPVRPTDGLPVQPPGGLPGGGGSGSSGGSTAPQTISIGGMGDAKLRGEFELFGASSGRPGVHAIAEMKAPTADETEGLGTGEVDYTGGLGMLYPLGRASLLLDASYTRVGDPDQFDFDDVTALGGGLAWKVGQSDRRQMFVYTENRTSPVPGVDDRLDASLGLSGRAGRGGSLRFSASVLVGLSDSTEDYGVSFGFGRSF